MGGRRGGEGAPTLCRRQLDLLRLGLRRRYFCRRAALTIHYCQHGAKATGAAQSLRGQHATFPHPRDSPPRLTKGLHINLPAL